MYQNKEIYCDLCYELIPSHKALFIKTSAPKPALRVDIRVEAKHGRLTYCTTCVEKMVAKRQIDAN